MFRTSHILLKLFLTAVVIGLGFLIYLDARITSTFIDKMWELPAKVYARPLELFVGARLEPDELAYELEVLGYRKVRHTDGPGQVARNRGRFEIYTRGFSFPREDEPARRILVDVNAGRVAA
ncbi:MAG: penicillin-binding protein 1B, partial [Pseudomonadota bacterium]